MATDLRAVTRQDTLALRVPCCDDRARGQQHRRLDKMTQSPDNIDACLQYVDSGKRHIQSSKHADTAVCWPFKLSKAQRFQPDTVTQHANRSAS